MTHLGASYPKIIDFKNNGLQALSLQYLRRILSTNWCGHAVHFSPKYLSKSMYMSKILNFPGKINVIELILLKERMTVIYFELLFWQCDHFRKLFNFELWFPSLFCFPLLELLIKTLNIRSNSLQEFFVAEV